MLFFVIMMTFICQVISLPLPFDQYSYMLARNKLTSRFNRLTFKENTVNLFMISLKHEEFHKTLNHFYPSRPIEDVLENITSSKIYKFLHKLPKGGNLHIHELQMLDRRNLLDTYIDYLKMNNFFLPKDVLHLNISITCC